jgi:ATP-binding cassette subfamily C protein LapB
MNVYDRVLPNKAIPTLWVLGIGLLIALIFDFILRMARALTIDYVGRRIDLRASSLLMERVLNARLSKGGASTGLMTQRLHDYEFVREFLTSNTIVFFIDLLFSVVFILVIVSLSPWFGIYPAIALICMGLLGLVIQRLIRKELARATASTALRQSLLVEMVGSLEVLKSLRGEGHLLRKWDTVTRDVSNVNERIKRYSAIAGNAAYFVQMSVTLVTVVIGAYLFEAGAVSTGAIIAAVMLASRAVSPAGQIALTLARARQAASAFRSIDSIMTLSDERSDRRLVVSRPVGEAGIEFNGATFAYAEDGRKVLDGLSLKFAPGERVAILGRVGVGKTTIGRLLARFHDLDSGQLLIDGIDIRQYHPHEVRRAITFVPQDAELLSGTLRDNLLVGKPEATDAELIKACQLAGVDEFVARHPQGYDMPVGERGGLLSSGQKQMVGLARALLASGKVLFLDDPTSSMDMASEKAFVERLRKAVKPGTTMIVTTHRNAVLRLVDRVVVIDQGRVVADGSAEAVLRRVGDAPQAPKPQSS